MVYKLTEERVKEIRSDMAKLLGIETSKIYISINKLMGFYLKIDISSRKMSVVTVFRTILHFIDELERHGVLTVLIKSNVQD